MGGDFKLMCIFKQRQTLMEPEENRQQRLLRPLLKRGVAPRRVPGTRDFPLPLLPVGDVPNKCPSDIVTPSSGGHAVS